MNGAQPPGGSACAGAGHGENLSDSQHSWREPAASRRQALPGHQDPGSGEHDQGQESMTRFRFPARVKGHCRCHTALPTASSITGSENDGEDGQTPPASARTTGPGTPGGQVVKVETGRRLINNGGSVICVDRKLLFLFKFI